MKKISTSNFKDNNGLMTVTILFGVIAAAGTLLKPEYIDFGTATIIALIGMPLASWWFMAFWNRILTKIFELKEISYGVAFILVAALAILF